MKKYVDNFLRYRFLLWELVKKGIKLKYRRSYLGIIWSMLEPLLTMIVLTIVFGLMLLYFILPNVKIRRFRYILPGTIFTSFVIVFLNNLFSNYILRTFERMVDIKTFGSVVIFVLMLWFIFLAHILILGAIFNATYQELRQGKMESRRGDILSILTHRKQDKDTKK